MKKDTIVFNQQDGQAYRMENGKLILLGEGCMMVPAWKDVVYRIGERLFIKENETYRRIASNCELIGFNPTPVSDNPMDNSRLYKGTAPGKAGEQIICRKGKCYFAAVDCGSLTELPEKFARFWLAEQEKATVMPEENNAFIINSDGEFRLFVGEQNSVPRVREAPFASYSGESFVWNGYGYALHNRRFSAEPFILLGIYDNYLLLKLKNDAYIVKDEGFLPVGSYPALSGSGEHRLMIAETEHGRLCYQLCPDDVYKVCFCTKDAFSSLEIREDGNVFHRSQAFARLYKPDKTGLYRLAEETA